ncbi:MAG: hypothetical protein O7D34_02135 [Ignavibacteria bacterium]|nr:hypothetical protein [Ignavibacteria bacterium]
MARNNPYALSVDLKADTMTVDVLVRERETDELIDEHSFPASSVHEDLRNMVGLYGLSKLLQDRSSDVKTGPEKLSAMKGVAEQLASGQWQKERKVGAPTVSAEVEALAQFKSISIPQAQAALRRYDKAAREQILGHEQIVALAKTIREARVDEEVADLSDLAGEAQTAVEVATA